MVVIHHCHRLCLSSKVTLVARNGPRVSVASRVAFWTVELKGPHGGVRVTSSGDAHICQETPHWSEEASGGRKIVSFLSTKRKGNKEEAS